MLCKACGNDCSPDQFYVSNQTRCKECIKAATRKNRLEKIEYYRSYDRMRGSQPHRVAARKEYAETDAYRESHNKASRKYVETQPKRRSAQVAVGNALRDGRLQRMPCLVCGKKAEAHHPDYDRPLDVMWLCHEHHMEAHALVANDENEVAA
jgi:hypothetical protein